MSLSLPQADENRRTLLTAQRTTLSALLPVGVPRPVRMKPSTTRMNISGVVSFHTGSPVTADAEPSTTFSRNQAEREHIL